MQTGKRSESLKVGRDSFQSAPIKWTSQETFFLDSDWFLDDTTVESGVALPNQIEVKVNLDLVSRQSIY